jgi:hypothetical protein
MKNQPVTTAIEFFPYDELECKGSRKIDPETRKGIPGTGIVLLDPRFAQHLPELRRAWGRPVTPNSVCRTPAHNAKTKGANPSSLHMTKNPKWPTLGCMAMDWPWRGWSVEDQLAFAQLAWRLGWSVGLHNGFCHVDRRADLGLRALPQHAFLYGTWSGAFTTAQVMAA